MTAPEPDPGHSKLKYRSGLIAYMWATAPEPDLGHSGLGYGNRGDPDPANSHVLPCVGQIQDTAISEYGNRDASDQW